MWAPLTTSALASLHTDLYPHGTAAFTTLQQLAGAAGGAVLISAYTIGSDVTDTAAPSMAQFVSAAQTAFTTAAVIAIAALVGVLFVRQTPALADSTQATSSNGTDTTVRCSPAISHAGLSTPLTKLRPISTHTKGSGP